jgi:serine/threonine protein kinase
MSCSKYCPPEYIEQKYVSNKFDIFSLGVVMIEIIAGSEGYHKAAEMLSQEFIDHVS